MSLASRDFRLLVLAQSFRECLGTSGGITGQNPVRSAEVIDIDEVEYMADRTKRQVRIIKRGTASGVPVTQSAIRQREERATDPMDVLIRGVSQWVTEFKAKGRPNPKSKFQALFRGA